LPLPPPAGVSLAAGRRRVGPRLLRGPAARAHTCRRCHAVVDRQRLRTSLGRIRQTAHRLPLRGRQIAAALGLIDEAMGAWATRRVMAFNAPQLALVAAARPDVDILLGKPLPASAARWALEQPGDARFDPSRQIQWLVDTPERLAEYGALAKGRGQPMRINIEIDVGLHRGGVETEHQLATMLGLLRSEPLLHFAGLMGYDAHLAAILFAGNRAGAPGRSQRRYAAMRPWRASVWAPATL
jgi:D-serine deaminase-like pyridoxal phosphate-dependent protein